MSSSLLSAAPSGAGRRTLDQNWSFRRVGDDAWLTARVPGSNFSDLLAHGLIPDPFLRDNEAKVQWVEAEDWEYRCLFQVGADDLAADRTELVFEGLDTFCEVRLNGAPLLSAANMFRAWRVDCGAGLRAGENELRLLFRSPIRACEARAAGDDFQYPAENDKTPGRLSVYARKAPYHFGWDWGPKLVASGVWKPVRLETFRGARIAHAAFRILSLADDRAEVEFAVEAEVLVPGDYELEIASTHAGVEPARVRVTGEVGTARLTVPIRIDQPQRWWPNGMGEAHLYPFEVHLTGPDGGLDERALRVGLRTIEVVNRPDEAGESFFVVVNGRPTFMKGANYIPPDSLLDRVTPERQRRTFRDIVDAKMNMVRVWGGGVYESDLFYDLADEHGVLVWQDFMFACSLYPSDDAFLAEVAAEARDVIRRLRSHPSLALWCGNNEISLGVAHWDWPEKFGYSAERYAALVEGAAALFDRLLPGIVAELDPDRFYFPSSPIGFWNDPAQDGKGDGHYWGVWHGELPFSTYDQRLSRFMSEYGFQSYPAAASVERFTAPEDRAVGAPALAMHQKHPRGDAIITRFIRDTLGEPRDFEQFCYMSQVVQADGLRVAFEAHRRNRPFCMGSLYWQLNDCWPAASWSGVDWLGRWKALHYQAARSFAPAILSIVEADDGLAVYGVSDLPEAVAGTLELRVVDFDGKEVWRRERTAMLEADASRRLGLIVPGDLPREFDPASTILVATFRGPAGVMARGDRLFLPVRDLALPDPDLAVEVVDARSVRVSARRFARAVQLTAEGDGGVVNFADNFFDLLPGEIRIVPTREAADLAGREVTATSIHGARAAPERPAVPRRAGVKA